MYWIPDKRWEGKTVAILASGPSMAQSVADSVKHLPRIAVNTTYQLAPDADIVYAADAMWWNGNLDAMKGEGLKVSIENSFGTHPNTPEGVRVLKNGGVIGFDDRPGYLRTGGNGGYQAICLAVQMGAKQILLFGFDCHGGHWHGDHPKPLDNPTHHTYDRWIRHFNVLAPILALRGVEVVNCTANSAIKCFVPRLAA